jgi:nicotinate-nucleotide pyrophosphorylase (carboxylating)
VIAAALAEDLGVSAASLLGGALGPELLERDVTSSAVIPAGERFKGLVVARSECVVCGLPVAEGVWAMLSRVADDAQPVEVYPLVAEGAVVEADTPVAEVEGSARTVLAAEQRRRRDAEILGKSCGDHVVSSWGLEHHTSPSSEGPLA